METPLPSDDHVHSQFSYDTSDVPTMEATCAEAVRIGLPSVAFTEHLDFDTWGPGDAVGARGVLAADFRDVGPHPPIDALDVEGYTEAIAKCRELFPQLRILSGVESGEAHLFAASLGGVLASHRVDRVLGSVHSLVHEGRLVDADRLYEWFAPHDVMEQYFTEVLALVEQSDVFEVLAHADYARRYWPASAGPYPERAFEEHYRTVFRVLAAQGRVLEINTKSDLWTPDVLRWWHQEGGGAVSFGSDAHRSPRVGQHFRAAMAVVEASGFRPSVDPLDFWRR